MFISLENMPYNPLEDKPLPGVGPCPADKWLWLGPDYAAQMQRRSELLQDQRAQVLAQPDAQLPICQELLQHVLEFLRSSNGFTVLDRDVVCPDGRIVALDPADPLGVLGHLVQEDFCLLQKSSDEFVLRAAVLCFPAAWSLHEKMNRPLMRIHAPAPEYDAGLAKRVGRLFDAIQPGRPLWRFNRHFYDDAELCQPHLEAAPRQPVTKAKPFLRSERQTLYRLPRSGAVVFGIRTFVLRPDDYESEQSPT